MLMKMRVYCALGLLLLSAGCGSHRPIEELTMADLAVKSAQKSKADVLASDLFRKAENLFLRAKRDYSEGYFESSRKFSTEARLSAEQAEFQALLKQTKVHSADTGSPAPAAATPAEGKLDEWTAPPAPIPIPPKIGP